MFPAPIGCDRDWIGSSQTRLRPAFIMGRRWPDTLDLVTIDGKTSRRSHDRKRGQALHLVSAFATTSRWCWAREWSTKNSPTIR